MIFGYVPAKQHFVLFQSSRWHHRVVMSCPPDLTTLLACRQIYVECRLLPFFLRRFRFLGSLKTTNRIIRSLQPPQQAALRSVEVKVEDMYHVALEVLTGLHYIRFRHENNMSRKMMLRWERSICFITKKEDLKFEWVHQRPRRT